MMTRPRAVKWLDGFVATPEQALEDALMPHVHKLMVSALTSFAVVLAAALPAGAQGTTPTGNPPTHPMDLGVGYVFTHLSQDGTGQGFPIGVVVDFARAVKQTDKATFSLVGQFQLSFGSQTGESDRFTSFAGGMRYSRRSAGRLTPFGEVLLGYGSWSSTSSGGGFNFNGAEGGLGIQAQAGVTFPLGTEQKRSMVRAGVPEKDYSGEAAKAFGVGLILATYGAPSGRITDFGFLVFISIVLAR